MDSGEIDQKTYEKLKNLFPFLINDGMFQNKNKEDKAKKGEIQNLINDIAENIEDISDREKFLTGEENLIDNLIIKFSPLDLKGKNIKNIDNLTLKLAKGFNMLNDIGYYIPNLNNLQLTGSCIESVEEVGVSFKNLRILNLSNCKLKFLTGIICFENLNNLDVSYNEIEDVYELDMCTNIQILKINNNLIQEKDNFLILQSLTELKELYISNNPFTEFIGDYKFDNVKLDI